MKSNNCIECNRAIGTDKRCKTQKASSKKCISCSHKKRPFEHIYKRFCNSARFEDKMNSISYEQFMKLTEIKNCEYCMMPIPWKPYAYVNNRFVGAAYFLDRKDNSLGYSIDNVVVCCTECNKIKSNRFSHSEFCIIAVSIRSIYEIRKAIENHNCLISKQNEYFS